MNSNGSELPQPIVELLHQYRIGGPGIADLSCGGGDPGTAAHGPSREVRALFQNVAGPGCAITDEGHGAPPRRSAWSW
jgi:hypothetical protein